MFEHLKNDPQFQTLDSEGRRNWLENYKYKEVEPLLQGVSEEERTHYNKRVEDAFWADTNKTDWEAFRDTSHDLIFNMPRLAARVSGLAWEGIEAGADAMGADKLAGYAASKVKDAEYYAQKMVRNPDTVAMTDLAAESIPINAFIGRTMWAYKAFTSPWVQTATKSPFVASLFSTPADTAWGAASGMTANAATKAFMFSGSVGDQMVTATMNKYVQPAIDSTDMSPAQKQWSTMGAYLLLGFASGVGPELVLDKAVGNPLWRNSMDVAISNASKGSTRFQIPDHVWNEMDAADQAVVAMARTDEVDVMGNLARSLKAANIDLDISPEAITARVKEISDGVIARAFNKSSDIDGARAHEAQSGLIKSDDVGEILDAPVEVLDDIMGKVAPIADEAKAPETKPKPFTRNLTERAKEKRRVEAEAAEALVRQEKHAFDNWSKTADESQYNEIVQAYKRGPLIGKKKVKDLFGEAPNPDAQKAIIQHVKEIGEDGIHPARRKVETPSEEPAAKVEEQVARVEEPEVTTLKALEVASEAKPVPQEENPWGPKIATLVSKVDDVDVPVAKPVEALVETPVTKPVKAETPVEAPAAKVTPVQPANASAVRTTHNLPVAENRVNDPRLGGLRKHVSFAENRKPSNEQVEVLKAAGAVFDRSYMAWILPDTEAATQAVREVRKMAAPVKEPVVETTKVLAVEAEVKPAEVPREAPTTLSKGSVPVSEFVSNSGQRVLKFDENMKPTQEQKYHMKSNGVLWSAQYKGWIGADSAKTRQIMKEVRDMAYGKMPEGASEGVKAAQKVTAVASEVRVRKAKDAPTKPGKVTAITIEDAVDPEVTAWMQKNNIGARGQGGQVVQIADLPGIRKRAYNQFGPHSIVAKEHLENHINILRKLEDLVAKNSTPVTDGKFMEGLTKLRQVGVLNAQAYESAVKILNAFKTKVDARIATGDEKEFYSFMANAMNIKNADNLFHEVGHWAWWRGLKGEDRINFFRTLHTQHQGTAGWNRLSPMRAAYERLANSPMGTPQMNERMASSYGLLTELYADVFRQYIHTYRMTDAESLAFIRKGAGEMESVLGAMRQMQELPQEVKGLIDKILLRPRGDNKPTVNNIKQVMEENYRFLDKQTFEDSLSHVAEDSYGDAMSDAAVDMMKNQAVSIDAWMKTGEFEPTLNRILVETLGFFHYGAGDLDRLDRLIYGLAKQFEFKNYEDTLKLIAKAEQKNMEGLKLPQELMAEHVKKLYNEYKQFLNDIAGIHEAAKIHTKGVTTAPMDAESFMMRQQLALRDAAAKENIKYNGKSVSYDDTLGVAERNMDDGPNEWDMAPGQQAQNTLMRWRTAPQLVSAMMGLEVDNESGIPVPFTNVYLNWNPVTWAKRGGPLLSLYDAFGKAGWRMAKNNMMQKFSQLSPHHQTAITQKWNSVTKNDFVRALRPNSGLSDEVSDIVRAKWKTEGSFKRRVDAIARDLNSRFTIEEQRLIGSVISQEQNVNIGMLSAEGQAAVNIVEQLVADTHTMLRNAGISQQLLDEQGLGIIPLVFKRQGKEYWKQGVEGIRVKNVHETLGTKFLAHQGRHELWKQNDAVVGNLMQIVRNQGITLKPGDIVEEFLDSNGARMLLPQGSNIGTPLHSWKIKEFNTNAGTIRVNRKFTDLEKTIMKAEMSIVPRLAQFADDVAAFVGRAQAFDNISNNNNLSIDFNAMRQAGQIAAQDIDKYELNMMQRGWQYVPDTEVIPGVKRYGKLAGKLVDPEVMYAIRTQTSTAPSHPLANAIFTKYRQGVSLWKIGKTAFNPTTHGINFLGNSVMCMMDGRNPLNVLREGIVGLKQGGQFFQEAVEAGMVDSNILRSEFGLDRWLKTIEAQPNQHPTASFFGAAGSWIDGVSSLAKGVSKKAAYVPMRAYELGDQVYKMGVFIQARKAGMNPDDAMKEANRLFFDYRDVPQGVKVIRDYGIMPFVSYTYKLLPRMADFATNNPHRLIALIGGLSMFNNVLMANAFGEDWGDVDKFYKEMKPDWMNKSLYGTDVQGGLFMGQYTNERGQNYSEWMDYSQVIPGATMMDDGGIFGGFPFGTNPLVSIMYGLAANKDAALGQQIAPYPEAGENWELKKRNIEARLKFIARSLLPNLPVYPGAYSLERLGQGLTASGAIDPETADKMGWTGKDYYGSPEDATDALSSWATGVRNRRLYTETEFTRKLDKLSFGMKKEENELDRKYEDQRMSQEELTVQKNKMLKVIRHNSDEIGRIGRAYRKYQKAVAPKE